MRATAYLQVFAILLLIAVWLSGVVLVLTSMTHTETWSQADRMTVGLLLILYVNIETHAMTQRRSE